MDGVGVGLDGDNDEELSASWIRQQRTHVPVGAQLLHRPRIGRRLSDILACTPRIPLRSGAVPLSSGTGAQNGLEGEWINGMFIGG